MDASPEKSGWTDRFVNVISGAIDKRFNFTSVKLPELVKHAPGMLSRYERRLLYWLGRKYYSGAGAIIDGGSFLGSSLVASAQGLRENPRLGGFLAKADALPGGKIIHAYELGYLPAPKGKDIDHRRRYRGFEYHFGDSFVPVLEESARPYSDLVELHVGDILAEQWPDAPIEICFIDVCKTAQLNAHVTKQFFPRFIPGRTILMNQDFFYDRLPWIKVTMGYLSDYFEWIGEVFSTSAYLCKRPIPQEVVAYDPFTEGSAEECLAFHDSYVRDALSENRRLLMDLSRAYLLALKDRKADALAAIDGCETDYADLIAESVEAAPEQAEPRGRPQFKVDRARRQIAKGLINRLA